MTDPRTILKDAGYVAVGLGVIAFQRAQVRRRELEQQLGDAGQHIDRLTGALEDQRKLVEERIEALGGQVETTINDLESRVGKAIDELRERMPETAVETFDTAVGAAKDGVAQILDLVRPNTTAA
jgi:predicted  nucleic acid-binding Zn-ribbon protein